MILTDKRRWELLTSLMSDGFFVLQDSCFIYVNAAFERLLGVKKGDVIGQPFMQYVHPEMRELVKSRYDNRLKGLDVPRHYEVKIVKSDAKTSVDAWVETHLVRDNDQQIAVAGTVRDIGSLKTLKNDLNKTRNQLHSIMANMSETIYQTNMAGEITLISENVRYLLGYTDREMTGTLMADYYWSPAEREKVVQAIRQNNGVVTNVEARLRRKDGKEVWISTNAYVATSSNGEALSIEGLARDVTHRKELQLKLEKQALTDSLTGLPNRRALMDELHQCIYESRRKQGNMSVIYFDVNHFKQVNDKYGHLVGDMLLTHVARTLENYVSERNMFGRLSGDEFLFILPGFALTRAKSLAELIAEGIKSKPLQTENGEVAFSLAVGVSCLTDIDKNEFSLLDRADKAMYKTKYGKR